MKIIDKIKLACGLRITRHQFLGSTLLGYFYFGPTTGILLYILIKEIDSLEYLPNRALNFDFALVFFFLLVFASLLFYRKQIHFNFRKKVIIVWEGFHIFKFKSSTFFFDEFTKLILKKEKRVNALDKFTLTLKGDADYTDPIKIIEYYRYKPALKMAKLISENMTLQLNDKYKKKWKPLSEKMKDIFKSKSKIK